MQGRRPQQDAAARGGTGKTQPGGRCGRGPGEEKAHWVAGGLEMNIMQYTSYKRLVEKRLEID